jgi:hypothetical protein
MIEHFILPDDGPLLRLPRSVVEQLLNRKARLPQYADIKLRWVQVLMNVDEAGAPRAVVRLKLPGSGKAALGQSSEDKLRRRWGPLGISGERWRTSWPCRLSWRHTMNNRRDGELFKAPRKPSNSEINAPSIDAWKLGRRKLTCWLAKPCAPALLHWSLLY